MKKVILRTILGIAVLHIVLIAILAFAFAYPTPTKALREYGDPNAPYISGLANHTPFWFFSKENCQQSIVISHGRSRHKAYMSPLIDVIWERTDLCIMAIDFPSHGERGYGKTTIGPRESEGVLDALEWLKNNQHNNVFLFGVSMGGSATLYALSERQSSEQVIRGVVIDGTYAKLNMIIENVQHKNNIPQYIVALTRALVEWWVGYDIGETAPDTVVSSITSPLLVLHGDKDPLAPPISAQRIAASASDSLAFWYDGFHDDPSNEVLQNIVVSFIQIVQNGREDWQQSLMERHSKEYRAIFE